MVSRAVARFEIWLVRLDPAQGSELRKTRPAVIVSPDEMNAAIRTVVVCPLTSTRRNWPTRIAVDFEERAGDVALDQIRAVDQSRLIRHLGMLTQDEAVKVSEGLQAMFAW